MFPTSNNENPNFLSSRETLLEPPFPCDQNPISTLEEDIPLLYFPSPFLDDHDMHRTHAFSLPHQHQHQHQQQQQQYYHQLLQSTNGKERETPEKNSTPVTTKKKSLSLKPRKRIGKKDRHSKICTAQGVRDRRMRLSVHIARKFFDLQDALGFDKASKTIEWLFSNSKDAIKELFLKHNASTNNVASEGVATTTMGDSSRNGDEVMNEKNDCNILQARESRDKARARARERTREKMMIRQFHEPNPNPNSFDQLGFSNPSPFLEESSNSYIANNITSISDCNLNIREGISGDDTDSIIINSFMGSFLGNWELETDITNNHFPILR